VAGDGVAPSAAMASDAAMRPKPRNLFTAVPPAEGALS
jgi:hypothetical protein